MEPFIVFTGWVSLSVLGVFYAIQAFTIEGKYFDAFVEVSAVFPCQSEDLLRPRLNGTHSCQLALLADAASQLLFIAFADGLLRSHCLSNLHAHTPAPSPELPNGCTMFPNR